VEENLALGRLVTFVPNKRVPIHNWFYFKEGFSKDFVLLMLKELGVRKNERVLDPFCGVGTTMLAAKEVGTNSLGVDASPLFVFVSRVKIEDYDPSELREAASSVFSRRFSRLSLNVSPLVKRAFPRHVLEDVLFFKDVIAGIEDERVRNFFTLALMSSAIKASYIMKEGAVIKFRKRPIPPFRRFFRRRVKRMIDDVEKTKFEKCEAWAVLGDARNLRFLADESFDAVITSPPYLNIIDYAKVYEVEYDLFFRHARVDPIRSYIGFNVSSVRDVVPDVDVPPLGKAYFYDISLCLGEIHKVLRGGGRAAIVMGEGVFPDRIVPADVIAAGLAERTGLECERILVVNRRVVTDERRVKIGVARESILFLRKA